VRLLELFITPCNEGSKKITGGGVPVMGKTLRKVRNFPSLLTCLMMNLLENVAGLGKVYANLSLIGSIESSRGCRLLTEVLVLGLEPVLVLDKKQICTTAMAQCHKLKYREDLDSGRSIFA
jgi:hypothetical protein